MASVNLLSAPWGIRGCAAAAPRSMGGWGCPIHPPWPLWEGAWLFLYITGSPQFSFVSPSEKRSCDDLWLWESCVGRRKMSFPATCRLFLYPLPPLAGFIDGRRLWGWMCVHASRSQAVLVRAAFWPPAPRQHPSPWSISEDANGMGLAAPLALAINKRCFWRAYKEKPELTGQTRTKAL